MTRRVTGAVFWLLAAMLLAANVAVVWHSLVVMPLWEDEAFNLTVPRNLLAGLGYASDGTLSGSTVMPFDVRISTGPVVLLPIAAIWATGVDMVIGARLVPVAYWIVLLAGVWLLGRRIAGRWGALAAAATAFAFNTTARPSPIQGPADVLGEIAAAALIVWALVLMSRRAPRLWLVGLLVGLAVQAKLIALLALPAFVVALWVLTPGTGWPRFVVLLRRSVVPLMCVALPTLVFEVAALFTLGVDGFVEHLRQLRAFLLSSGQTGEPTTIAQKLAVFAQSWFGPTWLVLAVVAVFVVACSVVMFPWRRGRDTVLWALAGGSAAGLFVFIAWWAQASQTPLWVRHPAVGVFAFAPLLAAFGVRAIRMLWVRREGWGWFRMLSSIATVALAAMLSVGVAGHVEVTQHPGPGQMTLQKQRDRIAPITEWVQENDVSWLAAKPWGANVSFVVLTGAHVGLWDAPSMRTTPQLWAIDCEAPFVEVVAADSLRVCVSDR